MRSYNATSTIHSCFFGYITQAIVNVYVPLLFVTFQNEFGLSLPQVTLLITFNFGVQLLVDLVSVTFVDRIGYRASVVLAHVMATLGLVLLSFLPNVMAPFAGILISVSVYAVGGGLLEVVVSPIVESCPNDHKEKTMSLLHSFYCWGCVGVILISTAFFAMFGRENWRILLFVFALVPAVNGFRFTRVPLYPVVQDGEQGMRTGELLRSGLFWQLAVMMILAGASEQGVSQWASAFAEKGLGVAKATGDLLGAAFFSVLMGTSRLLFGKFGTGKTLWPFMLVSLILCVVSYLLISLSPSPVLSLIGCGTCGFSVGILWPGTFSIASRTLPRGGTAMFALLALGGDIGCSGGPTFVGLVADAFGGSLHKGILLGTLFPALMLGLLVFTGFRSRKKSH